MKLGFGLQKKLNDVFNFFFVCSSQPRAVVDRFLF